MEREDFNMPLSLKRLQVRDAFWGDEMELVRTEVIPYQWEALNDRVENAAPSFCMRNFKLAGRMNRERLEKGALFQEPEYCFRGFDPSAKRARAGFELLGFRYNQSSVLPCAHFEIARFQAALLIGRLYIKADILKPYMQEEGHSMPAAMKGAISFRPLHVPHFTAHSHPE